jgi:hypothetical protein
LSPEPASKGRNTTTNEEFKMKSELKFWRWAAVIAVLALGIVGSIAVAAPKGGGSTSTNSSPDNQPRLDFKFELGGPRDDHLSDLAKELGVSTSKLKSAIEAALKEVGPPKPPTDGQPPSKADMEKHCTELTDALASKLDTTGDKVRAAIKTVLKDKIEAAVDAGKLTRAQADKAIARINDSACLPPFGGHKIGFGGCGGGPGRGHFERHEFRGGPPPGAGIVVPAPAPSTDSSSSAL